VDIARKFYPSLVLPLPAHHGIAGVMVFATGVIAFGIICRMFREEGLFE